MPNDAKCKTGQGIYDYLELRRKQGYNVCPIYFFTADNMNSFMDAIQSIAELVEEKENISLYLDCHGFDSSIGITIGEQPALLWDPLLLMLEPVLCKIGNESILALGMCNGYGIASHLTNRLPFKYVITTTTVLSSLDVEVSFGLFFESLTENNDIEILFSQVLAKRTNECGLSKFCLCKRPS